MTRLNMDYAMKYTEKIRGYISSRSFYTALICACYVKTLALELGVLIDDVCSCIEDIKDADVKDTILETFTLKEEEGRNLKSLFIESLRWLPSGKDDLAAIALDNEVLWEFAQASGREGGISEMTPPAISKLALRLLGCKKDDRVIDLFCGQASFLLDVAQTGAAGDLCGYVMYRHSSALAKMRSSFSSAEVDVFTGSALLQDKMDKGSYDKAFACIPFGIKFSSFLEHATVDFKSGESTPLRFKSDEWYFVLRALERLNEGGRAVAVVLNGCLSNGQDEQVREFLLSTGRVEGVISLPGGLFANTNVACSLLVLSSGNNAVKMVDATEIGRKGRKLTSFTDADIDEIMDAYLECCMDFSKCVPAPCVFDLGCNLLPMRYLEEEVQVRDAVPLKDVANDITRGSGMTKSELEKVHTTEQTCCRYLMLQDIIDGEISKDLPFITGIEKKQLKYCVEDGDIVMSKIGPSFKVAVAEVPEGESILATGNLYIIRPDRDKINPYYLKLCLTSEVGMTQIQRGCTGTTMPSIPVKALGEVKVPLIPLDEQSRIVGDYKRLRDKIALHRAEIRKLEQEVADLL